MIKFVLFLAAAASVSVLGLALLAAPPQGRLHIISSSHQDIAWMDSPEKCIDFRDKNCITPALAMMAKDPAYSFTMENMLNLREYLERHPERAGRGRPLHPRGPDGVGRDLQPALRIPPQRASSSSARPISAAAGSRRPSPARTPASTSIPTSPAGPLQMPQILAKAGIPYMVMSRYHEGFYRWASPDGTSVLAYSPGHYGNAAAYLNANAGRGSQGDRGQGGQVVGLLRRPWPARRVSRCSIPSTSPSRPTSGRSSASGTGPVRRRTPSGRSCSIPRPGASSRPLDVKTAKLDTITGERPNLWLYIHGPTHHWAISAQREAGTAPPGGRDLQHRPRPARRRLRRAIRRSASMPPGKRPSIPTTAGAARKARSPTACSARNTSSPGTRAGDALQTALAAIAGRIETRPPAKGTPDRRLQSAVLGP